MRQVIRAMDPSRPPGLQEVHRPRVRSLTRLAVLPGSFNPLTNAHLALARAALQSGLVDAVDYLLASRTVNKERIEGASLSDRLICLTESTRSEPREGVMLVNRGLYVEQAEDIRLSLPSLEELWFVVGYDKIVQIFDHRYYVDRDAALDRLFTLASFLVSPRDKEGATDLRELLERPENRRYADRIQYRNLAETYRRLSSTRLRQMAKVGGVLTDAPPIVLRFVAETHAYEPPIEMPDGEKIDRYAWREKVIDLLAPFCSSRVEATFPTMVERVIRPDDVGRHWREKVDQGDIAGLIDEVEHQS